MENENGNVNGFEHDVFISYAHIDNKPPDPKKAGWVTQFHRHLKSYLGSNLGEQAIIWRDKKLTGSDVFGSTIIKRISTTAVLVSVLSERYFKSEWCIKEIYEFCRVVKEKEPPGLVVDDKARVLKVMLKPIPADQIERMLEPIPDDLTEQLPLVMKDTLGYPFYQEEEGERTLPLDPAFGKKYDEAFKRKVYMMAQDIAALVKTMEEGADPNKKAGKEQPSPERTVYLAECYDRWNEREQIAAALIAYGYTVLPDLPLPGKETDYVAEVKHLLAQCKLSIHLVGDLYGMVPGGPTQKSGVILQNELAVEQSRRGVLQRMIWVPENTHSDESKQQAFIEALHEDAETQFGADVITGSLEDLKDVIFGKLEQIEKAARAEPVEQDTSEDSRKMIYVICDKKDQKATLALLKSLTEQGFAVRLPAFEGSPAAMREANEELHKACDAVIVYYGAGKDSWRLSVERERRKMRAYRDKPLLAAYTYLAPPKKDDKVIMKTIEDNVIDGLEGFSEAAMDPFHQAVNPS